MRSGAMVGGGRRRGPNGVERQRSNGGSVCRDAACLVLLVLCCLSARAAALRPIRERVASSSGLSSWSDEQPFLRRADSDFGPYAPWNITGTYTGTWRFLDDTNGSSRLFDFGKSNGVSIFELVSTPTKLSGVHYVQGAVTFRDVFDSGHDFGVNHMRVEGVYMCPFRQLRMVASSGTDGEPGQEEYFLSNPYHLLGAFSSQVFQESPKDKIRRRKSLMNVLDKHCSIEIAAQLAPVAHSQNDGAHERYHLEGIMESPAVDDDSECFSAIGLNATSVNIEIYYNKAVNYTLMVTFVSFLQVLLLIRQMEHSNTQSGAAKVSILMIGQQAIMDAYLCLLHLTAGILVESLFNAFATAAFFKFVVFSIFEMRYLLAIWKANRPMNSGEGWEAMRRELSVLYSRFYGVLLGGILVMYELRSFLRPILLLLYSFWIPQIVTNVLRDTRKPLHPHYILGMSMTRLAVPLYTFGCPNNFMRIEVDKNWCICLGVFMGAQAIILLLQHYLGSRWFIPRQVPTFLWNHICFWILKCLSLSTPTIEFRYFLRVQIAKDVCSPAVYFFGYYFWGTSTHDLHNLPIQSRSAFLGPGSASAGPDVPVPLAKKGLFFQKKMRKV